MKFFLPLLASALLCACEAEPAQPSVGASGLEVGPLAARGDAQKGRLPFDGPLALARRQGFRQTRYASLGVNATWADTSLLESAGPELVAGAFRHVRFYQLMEFDFGIGRTPGNATLAPCLSPDDPESCDRVSPLRHLRQLVNLRRLFPYGYIFVAPEVLYIDDPTQDTLKFPCKNWSVGELGADPRDAGYRWARAALATFGQVPGVVLAMTNEEWCKDDQDPGRAATYNEWRRGIIQAHRENPACQLSIGARSPYQAVVYGGEYTSAVNLIDADIWQYVNDTGGWADYHAHPTESGYMVSRERVFETEDFRNFDLWADWLDANYPDIRRYVGEVSYTSSAYGALATDEQKRGDWATLESLVRFLERRAELVFVYQLADRTAGVEGSFAGTGVYPVLMDSVRAFAAERIGPAAVPERSYDLWRPGDILGRE